MLNKNHPGKPLLILATALFSSLFIVFAAFAQDMPKTKTENHVGSCAKATGVNKARCERHETMAAKCGAVKGDAHFACDREYLIANPLDCTKLAGVESAQCKAEVAAFKTCELDQGREFMKCVRGKTGESPMGH